MVARSDCGMKTRPADKKASKPLMEKKRRARINKCLDQLKYLLESYYSNNIRKRKLEKADILELTVKHLRNLQKLQNSAARASEFPDYQAGFRSCLASVHEYLLTAEHPSGRNRCLLSRLSSQGERSSTKDSDSAETSTQDASVQQRLLPSASRQDASVGLLAPCVGAHQGGHTARTAQPLPAKAQEKWTPSGLKRASATQDPQGKNISSASCHQLQPVKKRHNETVAVSNVWRPW